MTELLVCGTWRQVLVTITAFTAAHSITLAAASLGVVRIPGGLVEATIALSIVYVVRYPGRYPPPREIA